MARGGKRRGAGRKAQQPRVQIPVRVPHKLRQRLELLAKQNGDISLTKQTELLLVEALNSPLWSHRLEERLRQEIEVAAKRNGRSIGEEIADRLERSFWGGNEDHNQALAAFVESARCLKHTPETLAAELECSKLEAFDALERVRHNLRQFMYPRLAPVGVAGLVGAARLSSSRGDKEEPQMRTNGRKGFRP